MEKIEWSGRTSAYLHNGEDWKEKDISKVSNGVRKITVLDAQWSTCPVEVESQVKDLWHYHELGNDRYVCKTNIKQLKEIDADPSAKVDQWVELDFTVTPHTGGWTEGKFRTNAIVQYLQEQGVTDDKEEVWIHWWW